MKKVEIIASLIAGKKSYDTGIFTRLSDLPEFSAEAGKDMHALAQRYLDLYDLILIKSENGDVQTELAKYRDFSISTSVRVMEFIYKTLGIPTVTGPAGILELAQKALRDEIEIHYMFDAMKETSSFDYKMAMIFGFLYVTKIDLNPVQLEFLYQIFIDYRDFFRGTYVAAEWKQKMNPTRRSF